MRSSRSLLPLALVALAAACGSGPDPSGGGGDVTSVLVGSNGSFIGSAVLDGNGGVFLTNDEAIGVVRFQPTSVVPSTWASPTSLPEIELALVGDTLWWAANDSKESVLWTLATGSIVQSPAPAAKFPGVFGGDVVGLVADTKAVYAAVSSPTAASIGLYVPSPDSWQWPGSPVVTTPFSGDLYRIPTAPIGPAVKLPAGTPITFFPGFMQHVLAESSTQVFWADSTTTAADEGLVMAAAKATWASDPGHRVGAIQAQGGVDVGFVGLAADDTTVAWAAAPLPYPGATGCWVYASTGAGTPKAIFDSNLAGASFLCNGLAIDTQYAYFATTQVYVPPAGPGSSTLLGTGIARVPLTGGPAQTVSLQSDRWYGPRRVLVDDTYVYAIDPSFVLRFPKTVFGP